jgi:hypothetical protein
MNQVSEEPKRPWHSFRWSILLWIFGPLALIATNDVFRALNRQFPTNPLVQLATFAFGVFFYGLLIFVAVRWLLRLRQ